MNPTATALTAATRAVVARQGLAATTSRDIAAEAGANLQAITYHFGSKDALVATALLDGFRGLLEPALALLDADGDPAVRTVEIVRTLLTTLEERPEDAAAYVQALAHTAASPELRAGISSLWADLRQSIAADMATLQVAGILGTWVDPDAMAGVLVATANGLLVQAVVDPTAPDLAAQAAQVATLLLQARDNPGS
jgi:AcrR family transcriptional regulator